MARNVDVKLNMSGVREVLKSPGVQRMLAERGSRVEAAARGAVTGHARDVRGYTAGLSSRVRIHRVEAVARIGTTYPGAQRMEAKSGILARSIGAAS